MVTLSKHALARFCSLLEDVWSSITDVKVFIAATLFNVESFVAANLKKL